MPNLGQQTASVPFPFIFALSYSCVSIHLREMPCELCNSVKIIGKSSFALSRALICGGASDLTLCKTALDIHQLYTLGIRYRSQAPVASRALSAKGELRF